MVDSEYRRSTIHYPLSTIHYPLALVLPLPRRLRGLLFRLASKMECGVDQPHVRERLRKVADLAPALWIVFFREQPHVVAQRQQPFEDRPGIVMPAEQHVVVGQPETAREKGA